MNTEDPFETLLQWIEEEVGFATSFYNKSYLDRRISSRMRRTGADDYEAYLELLKRQDPEREALSNALSINVTGFFRNPDVWEGIRDVLKSLSTNEDEVRVWSAACADGREPYSIAMLAHDDADIDPDQISIIGTDISEDALRVARSGVYEQSRTVDIGEELEYLTEPGQYVERNGDTFRVQDSIRDLVTFEKHDLINDERKEGFDLVICRNLFIYINNEHKEAMLETIAHSLQPNGYFVIGKAETIPPQMKSAFNVLDSRLRIYRCKRSDSHLIEG